MADVAQIDTISLPPTVTGRHGRAWAVDLETAYRNAGKDWHRDGSIVACWLVEAEWAHPFWHSYSVSLIHLRPNPDIPDPKIYLDGATHEIAVCVLDPDENREAMIRTGVMQQLLPANFAAQMIEASDEAAAMKVRIAVEAICDGMLSPDTDFIRAWIALFGDNMVRK